MTRQRPLTARRFIALWALGLTEPGIAFDEIGATPGVRLGASAVLVRFGVTALTEMVPLVRLRRQPFSTPRLRLGRSARFDGRDVAMLPMFGFAIWGLMGTAAWAALRLAGRPARPGPLLNIVGMAMLIPMPLLWMWDWLAIARNCWRPLPMAASHAVVELWEGALIAVGLHRVCGLHPLPAALLGQALGAVYVLGARLIVRG